MLSIIKHFMLEMVYKQINLKSLAELEVDDLSNFYI
jgi:hypothetical protein